MDGLLRELNEEGYYAAGCADCIAILINGEIFSDCLRGTANNHRTGTAMV
jgi:hypothetical protein